MTKLQQTMWWVYAIASVTLLFFLAPALISAPDTIFVLFGVLLLVLWAVWSWKLWIKSTVQKIKGAISQ